MNENLIEDEKLAAKLLGQNLVLSTAAFPLTDFKGNLIRYLMKNVNGRLLFKLMNLNKWFIPKNLKFECFNDMLFAKNKYTFSTYLWITGKLDIYKLQDIPLFFQKLLYCNLKNVRLNNVILKFNDFKQLIIGGNVESLYFYESAILNDFNEKAALIDDIIDLTPKLKYFLLVGPHIFDSFTGGIAKKLIQTNVECIRMYIIPESFDIQTFVEIIREKSVRFIDYSFDQTVSDEYVAKVKEICPYEHIRTWYGERIENRPYPCLHHNDRGGQ
uniref:Uncharacterized protein n=1 Tax=Panagrolaimus davidi TaxID=227884 RepID=A0A914Q7W0_9BILA